MGANKSWRLRYTYIDSLTEKWNLSFEDVMNHVNTQKAMRHEFIIMEERPGYCSYGLRHPSVGDSAVCTVWTDNPDEARKMQAGLRSLATGTAERE